MATYGNDYNTIDRPYNNNLERSDQGIIGAINPSPENGTSSLIQQSDQNSGVSEISNSSQLSSNAISGESLKDIWIDSWIKSKNYKPKSQGFLIDGGAGYIECMKLYVGGGGIVGGSLDVPDTTTSNSMHVDANGNTWWGSNLTTGYAGANAYILNTGEAKFKNITLETDVTITGIQSGSEISIQSWGHTLVFSSVDADTVAWTSGTIKMMDGTTYSISSDNTGDISATTYIYLNTSVSTTALQKTTTAINAVGSGKVLVAIATNSTTEATFKVFNSELMKVTGTDIENRSITSSQISTGTITANEILANTITASQIAAGTITTTEIAAGTITGTNISASTIITAGTGNNVAVLNGSDLNWRIYAGNAAALSAPFRVDKAGAVTCSNITITGGSVSSVTLTALAAGSEIAIQGWSHTMTFAADSATVVSWTTGTINLMDGTTYSITGSDTGTMSAKTFIYFDKNISTTGLQFTTTSATAIGSGKILIAICQNGTDEATFQVFGNKGMNLNGTDIVSNSITGNEISANTITSNKMSVSQLSAITADMGAITAGSLTVNTSGFIRGGQTGYATGTGFFLGYDTSAYKFSVGTTDDYITFDGTYITISAPLNVDVSFTAGEALAANDAVGLWGEIATTLTDEIASKSVRVEQANPTNNYAGFNLELDDSGGTNEFALLYFPNMPAVPSGTGITVLSIKINISLYLVNTQTLDFSYYDNTAAFTESTVTWNTKPTESGVACATASATGSAGYIETGLTTVSEAVYNNIRDYGLTAKETTGPVATFFDRLDTGNEPKIDVEIVYKVRDGRIYKTNATTADYAGGFMGFATTSTAESATIKIRTDGKLGGFTGLTAYSTYYLSDTDATISTSPGSNSKVVGRALSTTELQIKYSL